MPRMVSRPSEIGALSSLQYLWMSSNNFTGALPSESGRLGQLRYLTGIEGLTGFLLLTWSASFLFLEMQRYWPAR